MLLNVKNTHRKHGVEAVCILETKEKKEKNIRTADHRNVLVLRVMSTKENRIICLQ